MTAARAPDWHETNKRLLLGELAWLRGLLSSHAGQGERVFERFGAAADPSASALDAVAASFNLSAFERDVLLLCAAVELDASFAALCAAAQGDSRQTFPTFKLALAVLPEAHWSALAPNAPLRRWRLLELGAGDSLTTSPLRIDERLLHHIAGVPHLDARLRGLVDLTPAPAALPSTQRATAARIAEALAACETTQPLPVVHLGGENPDAKRAVAACAAAALGLPLYRLHAADIPAAPGERDALVQLWGREAALGTGALLVDAPDTGLHRGAVALIEETPSILLLASGERPRLTWRPVLSFEVKKPTPVEQKAAWERALGPTAARLNGALDAVVAQFPFSTTAIEAAGAELACLTAVGSSEEIDGRLWDLCRTQARGRLDELAERIEPAAGWDDLVLPQGQMATLRDIAAQVRTRATVYERWGFAAKGARGLGISALFAGISGTGKTMAAEVLARDLRLDLFRIDLSQVVSKYIGETEKNLRSVFDAAEAGGAVLLFDEADALFGKRSEVKDSHDRYANIEVSYLLQRMEAYRGLAVLTSNQKGALDQAFLRRIRFILQFPFPDAALRAEIWRRAFPPETPTEGLDPARLAQLNLPGGDIRNIALHGAFLAADAGEPVRMAHLLRAARAECAKLDRPISESELGGWA